jgi:hypothetical protein
MNVNFDGWRVEFDDLSWIDERFDPSTDYKFLKEDMLQIQSLKECGDIVDVSWRPSFSKKGQFYIVRIHDFNWDEPLIELSARTSSELEQSIILAVNLKSEQ